MHFIRSVVHAKQLDGLHNTLVKIHASDVNNTSCVSVFHQKIKVQLYDLGIMKENHTGIEGLEKVRASERQGGVTKERRREERREEMDWGC